MSRIIKDKAPRIFKILAWFEQESVKEETVDIPTGDK